MTVRTLAAGAGAVAAAAAVAHSLPAITTLPGLRRALTPSLSGIGYDNHIAVTFDDGPDPVATPLFLQTLKEHKVRATFFMLGSMVARSPKLTREVADAGHEIALHGLTHRCLLARTPRQTFDDLRRGIDALTDVTGAAPVWWRPPYGVLTSASILAARRLNLRPVLWTAWGRDWTARATAESVLRTVTRSLKPGGTVLLHDSDITAAPGSWRSTLAALPDVFARCRELGCVIGPLSEHGIATSWA